jgi:chromosome segregation ATPase
VSDEELTELQEELADARAELEQLRSTTADREARLRALRDELAEARRQAEARDGELAEAREAAAALSERVRAGAQRYRELALQQMPELPEELVAGETIEEIDEALGRARETVSKVRGHLESQAQAARVPVGAPVRSEPDLSGLSAAEKIERGLRQR